VSDSTVPRVTTMTLAAKTTLTYYPAWAKLQAGEVPIPGHPNVLLLIPDFNERSLIKSGGHGTVCNAAEVDGDQKYERVVKFPKSPDKEDALRREGRLNWELGGRNLVKAKVIDIPDSDWPPVAVVMHRMACSLEDVKIAGTTFSRQTVTGWAQNLVHALQDLHELGYIHRDLKPANLLFKLSTGRGLPSKKYKRLEGSSHLNLADFGTLWMRPDENIRHVCRDDPEDPYKDPLYHPTDLESRPKEAPHQAMDIYALGGVLRLLNRMIEPDGGPGSGVDLEHLAKWCRGEFLDGKRPSARDIDGYFYFRQKEAAPDNPSDRACLGFDARSVPTKPKKLFCRFERAGNLVPGTRARVVVFGEEGFSGINRLVFAGCTGSRPDSLQDAHHKFECPAPDPDGVIRFNAPAWKAHYGKIFCRLFSLPSKAATIWHEPEPMNWALPDE
jgi:serine/threonine protein kinase